MKVVLLAPTPPPAGGIASWTVRMKSVKLKNGWKVEVVDERLIGGRGVFNKSKKNLFFEIKRCLNIWIQLWKKLDDKEVKIVHSSIPAGTAGMLREYICAIITKFRRRKFIIHYRCTIPNMINSSSGLRVFKALTNKSDLVFALNSASKDFSESISSTKVILIPNFVESHFITENHTKKIANKIKTIVYVGGVIESKGAADIINVARKFSDIEFKLVGKPDDHILKLDMPSNVVICGEKNKEEVTRELKKADIFIFVSYFKGEGFSNALVEAMANGLPCIVSDWAANRDMIEDKGGIVVQARDIEAISNAILFLDTNISIRQKQSEWNINKVKENYVDNVVTAKYVDAYDSLLT